MAFGIGAGPDAAAAQMSVHRLAHMNFGSMVGGSTSHIQPTAGAAGRFQVVAPAGALVTLTFSLPSALVVGSSILPISFGATDAARSGQSNVTGATRFDPRLPLTTTVPSTGSLYIWIGGTVAPPTTQTTGTYTGTISLSVLRLL